MNVRRVKIGDVCSEISQRDPGNHPAKIFRYVDISTIERETKQILDPPTILGANAPSRARKQIQVSDVLVSTVRPALNAVAMVPDWLNAEIASTGFCVLRPNPDLVNPRFLYYRVRTPDFVQYLCDRATGASYPAVTDAIVKKAPIALPPLPEQKRIIAILDAAEALRGLREQADRRTGDLIPALFHEMFGDPATNPKGWPKLSLKDLCNVKGGKRLPKGEEYASEPTPFRYIRVSDFSGGMIDESRLLYLKAETQKQISRYTVGGGDIIISIAGTIGLTAVVPPSLSGANLTENAAKLEAKSAGAYDPVFLCETLRTPHAQGQIGSHTGQVTIGKLALFRIEKLRVILPPLSLQYAFAVRVAAIRATEVSQAASRRRLDDLFQSILHRAFRSEL